MTLSNMPEVDGRSADSASSHPHDLVVSTASIVVGEFTTQLTKNGFHVAGQPELLIRVECVR